MNATLRTSFGLFAVLATVAGGCHKDEGTMEPPPMVGTPVDPDPVPGPKPTPTPTPSDNRLYSGVYQANAPIDFTQPGALPGLTGPALAALADLHTKPGTALVAFGQAAGVQVLNDIGTIGRAALSALLDEQLGNLYMNNPSLDRAVSIIENVAEIAKTTVLVNTLTVHTPAANKSVALELQVTGATFELVDVNLNNASVTATIPMTALPAAKTSLASGMLTPRANLSVADADLVFDGGKVTLPMGDLLMQAIGQLVFKPLFDTSDFRQGLIKLIPCDEIAKQGAQAVASSDNAILKALFSESVLKTVCTTGVGYLADQLIAELKQIVASDVAISAGRGVLYDQSTSKPTADQKSDRVAEGAWTWSFGSTNVVSSFAGDRVGNAN